MWRKIRINQKAAVLLCSLVMLMNVSVIGSMAYLITMTVPVVNAFEPATVPNEVTEKFDGYVKNEVKVKNTGDADAYIRVRVLANWIELDENGESTGNIYAVPPVYGVDYSWAYQNPLSERDTTDYTSPDVTCVGTGWEAGADGYYYYTKRVSYQENQNSTRLLFTGCKPLTDIQTGLTPNQPEGYVLSIEILSQSVQADGVDEDGVPAVTTAWGITVQADGTLEIGGHADE